MLVSTLRMRAATAGSVRSARASPQGQVSSTGVGIGPQARSASSTYVRASCTPDSHRAESPGWARSWSMPRPSITSPPSTSVTARSPSRVMPPPSARPRTAYRAIGRAEAGPWPLPAGRRRALHRDRTRARTSPRGVTPMSVQEESAPVEVTLRGHAESRDGEYARVKVGQALAVAQPDVRHAHVVLERRPDPAVSRPARAEATVDVRGATVRAHAVAPTMSEAVDELEDRLRRRLVQQRERPRSRHRWTGVASDHEWRHGDQRR